MKPLFSWKKVLTGIVHQLDISVQMSSPAPCREGIVRVGSSDVPADGMALVPVNPSFALLKVYRIARQVSSGPGGGTRDGNRALLPYRRAGEHERPERAVERGADGVLD